MILVVIASVGVAISLGYYLVSTLTGVLFVRRASAPAPALPKVAPRVAVLKPLHGTTPRLADNAISFLESNYPRAEFIFGVSDYADRAAELPVALKPRYQFADITMSVGADAGAANPKVAKLIKMAERAPKADILVLSDADISVDRTYLRRVVGELTSDPTVGVVTCPYRAHSIGTPGSRLEALYVNTDFAPLALFSGAVEPLKHAFGATIAIKREALEKIGGFDAIKDVLADDFFLGRLVTEQGYKVKLSTELVTISCEEKTFSDFWFHQVRWARTYRTTRPLSLATMSINGPFWALVLLLATGFSPAAFGWLAAVLATRLFTSAFFTAKVLRMPEQLRDLWLVPIKDLVMAGVWFVNLYGNEVRWGGRRYRVLAKGTLRELKG